MVKEVFGDMLYIPESPHQKQFPSPENLKHKVMISTKPPEDPESRVRQILLKFEFGLRLGPF